MQRIYINHLCRRRYMRGFARREKEIHCHHEILIGSYSFGFGDGECRILRRYRSVLVSGHVRTVSHPCSFEPWKHSRNTFSNISKGRPNLCPSKQHHNRRYPVTALILGSGHRPWCHPPRGPEFERQVTRIPTARSITCSTQLSDLVLPRHPQLRRYKCSSQIHCFPNRHPCKFF